MSTKISIITISYNQATFLEQAIKSVVAQAYPWLEYIIVDGGSTDGSQSILERYRGQVNHILVERDQGPADALNKGFKLATGQVLGFLNSDDEYLPGCFDSVARHFESHPDVDLVSGCGYFIDRFGNRGQRIVPSRLSAKDQVRGLSTIFQQGTFFTRQLYERVGGFNLQNRTCWDGELFMEMALTGARQLRVAEDLALFRIHETSISGSGASNDKYERDLDRLHLRALSTPRPARNRVVKASLRCYKLLADPWYVLNRLTVRSRTR